MSLPCTPARRRDTLVLESILGICVAWIGLASPGWGQKVPDVRLDTGDPPGAAPSINVRIAAQGRSVYVVWEDERNTSTIPPHTDIYFNRSLDGGRTWLTPDVRLDTGSPPGAARSARPAIAASGSSVYVVWDDDRNVPNKSDIYFNVSHDGGTTWLPLDLRLDDAPPGTSEWKADLAVWGQAVYVVWQDQRVGGQTPYMNRSLDGGATWLPHNQKVGVGPTRADDPRIAVWGSAVYVLWEDWRHGGGSLPRDIYFNRSLDQGATWLPQDIRLNTGGSPGSGVTLDPRIVAEGGHVYAAWKDARNDLTLQKGDIYFNRSLDNGETWLVPDLRLDAGSPAGKADSRHPELAVSNGSVYVAWGDERNSFLRADIYFNRSLDDGLTWLDPDVRLDVGDPTGASWSGRADVLAQGAGVFVAWQDTRYNPVFDDILLNLSTDAGSTWLSTEIRLDTGKSPGTSNSQLVRLAHDGTSVYAVWEDRRDSIGNQDVYFNLALGGQPTGAGKAGTGGFVPALAVSGFPLLGATTTLLVTNGIGGAPGFVLAGFSGSASIPLFGGTLWIQPPLLPLAVTLGGAPGTPQAGSVSVPLTIPSNPGLIGLRLDFQGMFLDMGAPAFPVSLTNGLGIWVA